MNNVEQILKWIREVDIKTLPYDVVGIGWGPKEKDGKETGEYGVIFTVKEKKAIIDLDPQKIIPKDLNIPIDDYLISFKTDVKNPIIHEKIIQCNTPSDALDPVKQNRVRRRVLMGGIETMTQWGAYTGTLGIFVKDKTDGQIVALSNNHIFANSQVVANLLTPNEQGMSTTIEISAYQPTGFWKTTKDGDYIGKCKRAVLIGNGDPTILGIDAGYPVITDTTCDAAILELSENNLIDSVLSPNILNFNAMAPFQFATDAEIDSLAPGGSNQGSPIFRSGRTLGPLGYPGNTYSCNLSVYQLNTAYVGTYSGHLSYFSNSFFVRGNVEPGAGGDSGSAMFALYNQNNTSLSAWKLIGLLFAGPSNNSYTIGCRITNIAEALDIAPWDTTIPSFSSTKTIAISGNKYSNSIELSGRKFYQVGFL